MASLHQLRMDPAYGPIEAGRGGEATAIGGALVAVAPADHGAIAAHSAAPKAAGRAAETLPFIPFAEADREPACGCSRPVHENRGKTLGARIIQGRADAAAPGRRIAWTAINQECNDFDITSVRNAIGACGS